MYVIDALSLDPLRQLGRHARVHLHRRYMLRFFKYPHSQISCTRADLENFIGRTKIGLDANG